MSDNNKLISIDNGGKTGLTTLYRAFQGCTNLISISNDTNWTKDVTDMSYMFRNATSFNEDISSWDISNVTDMSYMFCGDNSFNQSLSAWNISNVDNMTNLFCIDSTLTRSNYDSILDSWSLLPVKNNVHLDVGFVKYSSESVSARDILTNNYYWIISDGGLYIPGPVLLYTLNDPNAYSTPANDYFGGSVAISDIYTIVGAYGEADAGGTYSGKAYIYNNSTGALLWTLDNPNAYDTSAGDNFGNNVSISNTYAIVGASSEDDSIGNYSGKAYIFNPSTGELLHTLDNPNAYGTPDSDQFGNSVSISETYCIVGASSEEVGSGRAYIFLNSTGELLHTLDNPNDYDTLDGDNFGKAVAISDTYAIIGADSEDIDGFINVGRAYIFDIITGNLLHTLSIPDVSGGYGKFGRSVSISESYSIVGAPNYNKDGYDGYVYIFDNITGTLLHTLVNPNIQDTSTWDYFGFSVAISDTYVVVGARYENTPDEQWYSGVVYIYSTPTGELLNIIQNQNPYGIYEYDEFGGSVSISNSYIAIGSPYASDVDGYYQGKAYIYEMV